LGLPAVYLFAIIFFWTPPHFWALSLLIQRDYQRANVPMLPVVTDPDYTALHIFLYSLALVGLTIMFALIPDMGWVYLATALALGAVFIGYAWRLKQESVNRNARRLYLYSLLYLALLFVAIMADSVI
jgi:protoheme IX farnesyltransferase